MAGFNPEIAGDCPVQFTKKRLSIHFPIGDLLARQQGIPGQPAHQGQHEQGRRLRLRVRMLVPPLVQQAPEQGIEPRIESPRTLREGVFGVTAEMALAVASSSENSSQVAAEMALADAQERLVVHGVAYAHPDEPGKHRPQGGAPASLQNLRSLGFEPLASRIVETEQD